MKKLFTLLLLVVAGWNTMLGQSCTPVTNLPDTIVIFPEPFVEGSPNSGITDTACVDAYYEFTFTMKTPATFTTPFGPVPLNSIDLATEGAVTNLPAGFDYTCNPPNCVFKKDSLGCLLIFGTASAGQEGVYDLGLNAVVRSVIDIPLTFPDPNLVPGNYYLHVKPAGSANCFAVNTNNIVASALQVKMVPNPAADQATLVVQAQMTGLFELSVFDQFGRRLQRSTININDGENRIAIDAGQLPSGILVYTLANEAGSISGKFVIERN